MDTTQIRQLVAAKIAGQGTNVDAGSALPDIINGLCDVLDNLPTPQELPIVEITEDLSRPYVSITTERSSEISGSPILRYNNELYTLASSTEVLNFATIAEEPAWFQVWFKSLQFDDGNEAAAYGAIVLYSDDEDNIFIMKKEL